MKLYKVTLKGSFSNIHVDYSENYVVANNPDEAYKKVRGFFDKEDIGFPQARELKTIELVAESEKYPDCGHILFN